MWPRGPGGQRSKCGAHGSRVQRSAGRRSVCLNSQNIKWWKCHRPTWEVVIAAGVNVDLEVVAEGIILGLWPDSLTQLQHRDRGPSAGLSVRRGGRTSASSYTTCHLGDVIADSPAQPKCLPKSQIQNVTVNKILRASVSKTMKYTRCNYHLVLHSSTLEQWPESGR